MPIMNLSSTNEENATDSSLKIENQTVDPNFIVLGGQKCATTWLFKQLVQHPQIFIPKQKELNFFNKQFNIKKGVDWYREQYSGYGGEKAIGECTPNYLWTTNDPDDLKQSQRNKNIPQIVHQYYPDIKLIAILREPVDRAISAFYHHIRSRDLPPNSRILDVCDQRGILSMGYYDDDLTNWLQYFSRDQLLVLFYDDIVQEPLKVVKQILGFLDVDDNFIPSQIDSHYNVRYGNTYLYLHYYIPFIARVIRYTFPYITRFNWPKIEVKETEKIHLKNIFAPHVKRLENILQHPTPWDY